MARQRLGATANDLRKMGVDLANKRLFLDAATKYEMSARAFLAAEAKTPQQAQANKENAARMYWEATKALDEAANEAKKPSKAGTYKKRAATLFNEYIGIQKTLGDEGKAAIQAASAERSMTNAAHDFKRAFYDLVMVGKQKDLQFALDILKDPKHPYWKEVKYLPSEYKGTVRKDLISNLEKRIAGEAALLTWKQRQLLMKVVVENISLENIPKAFRQTLMNVGTERVAFAINQLMAEKVLQPELVLYNNAKNLNLIVEGAKEKIENAMKVANADKYNKAFKEAKEAAAKLEADPTNASLRTDAQKKALKFNKIKAELEEPAQRFYMALINPSNKGKTVDGIIKATFQETEKAATRAAESFFSDPVVRHFTEQSLFTTQEVIGMTDKKMLRWALLRKAGTTAKNYAAATKNWYINMLRKPGKLPKVGFAATTAGFLLIGYLVGRYVAYPTGKWAVTSVYKEAKDVASHLGWKRPSKAAPKPTKTKEGEWLNKNARSTKDFQELNKKLDSRGKSNLMNDPLVQFQYRAYLKPGVVNEGEVARKLLERTNLAPFSMEDLFGLHKIVSNFSGRKTLNSEELRNSLATLSRIENKIIEVGRDPKNFLGIDDKTRSAILGFFPIKNLLDLNAAIGDAVKLLSRPVRARFEKRYGRIRSQVNKEIEAKVNKYLQDKKNARVKEWIEKARRSGAVEYRRGRYTLFEDISERRRSRYERKTRYTLDPKQVAPLVAGFMERETSRRAKLSPSIMITDKNMREKHFKAVKPEKPAKRARPRKRRVSKAEEGW